MDKQFENSTIKILKDQIAQMTNATYNNYKRIAELNEQNIYLRKKVTYLESKLEQNNRTVVTSTSTCVSVDMPKINLKKLSGDNS